MSDPKPFIGEHPHRCIYCKSGWLCQGKKCTVKVTSCWPCSTPAKRKEREDKRITARDKERNAGVTPNIFDHPLGEIEYTAVFPASSASLQISEYADYVSFSDKALDEAVAAWANKAAEDMANNFLTKLLPIGESVA